VFEFTLDAGTIPHALQLNRRVFKVERLESFLDLSLWRIRVFSKEKLMRKLMISEKF